MNIPRTKIIRLISLLFIALFTFSCTKDSDLLSDYVIDNAQNSSQSIFVQVRLVTVKNESITIETSTIQEEISESEIKIVDQQENQQELTDSGVKNLDLAVEETAETTAEEQAAAEQEAAEQAAAEQAAAEQAAAEQAAAEQAAAEQAAAEQAAAEQAAAEQAAAEQAAAEQAAAEQAAAEQAAAEQAAAEQAAAEQAAAEQAAAEQAAAEQAAAEQAAAEQAETVVTVVTPPTAGTAEVNEDNSVTYTPDTDAVGTDEFEYTVETTDSNQGTTTETVSVNVNTVNTEVEFWKAKFDAEWIDNDNQTDHLDAMQKARSGNKQQEYYYLGFYIDGLVKMWQATGDNTYLDTALNLIDITVNKAVSVGKGYKGWPNANNKGWALWDSFYWRHVSTLLRIMHKSPNLRGIGSYQNQYKDLLAFTEKHIWERYESDGLGNFYRSKTHMASHWARIGMELYVITGKQKYKRVFDNISFGTMVEYPSNLRKQLKKVNSAYRWSAEWNGSLPQDTSHGGAIVSFWVEAYENGMYWNKSDMNALVSALDNVIWKDNNGGRYKKFVDGSGNNETPGRINEWITLGRFDRGLQNKIKNSYTGQNLYYYGTQSLGIAALNARILADGGPVYPEIN